MPISRRAFLSSSAAVALPVGAMQKGTRPNIVFVLTDDQGFGDVSIHGNPHLKTPNMDSVAMDGVEFTQFQVCPVCSPTRSSLMTGRYHYRTGIVDTFLGRSMMYPDEVTLPEVLGAAGYRTAIFGKWHLGDNYPMRAMDQGFQYALVHRGGGIGQVSDPPGSSYFDPILFENGKQQQRKGYCTDVFFGAATKWITEARGQPFFAYIATNAPHAPLQIDEKYVAPFRTLGLPDDTAKVYGMVANIDENLGRLQAKLRELKLERDTILIFMTDNGPIGTKRFNGQWRGMKTQSLQGGIDVPCFLRWPGRFKAGTRVDRIAAHIDIMPTLLEACGVPLPKGVKFDGRSLLALAEGKSTQWTDRMLFTQWHRGDRPVPFQNSAVRTQRMKLVNGKELYDIEADPGEKQDLAAEQPETVARLRKGYEDWLADVSRDRQFVPPRIYIGTAHEDPVVLTRQDWRVAQEANGTRLGWWEVDVKRAGNYDVLMTLDPAGGAGEARFELNGTMRKASVAKGDTECRFRAVPLKAGPGRVETLVKTSEGERGARFVEIRQVG